MIKKDYAAAAVIDFLLEDMNFSVSESEQYANLLMEAQAFTMPLQDLMTLINESGRLATDPEKDIRVELPFASVYTEYTNCSCVPNMEDVNRCGIFMVGNHANMLEDGVVCPVVYMTIHYLNDTQLCTGALVQQSIEQTVVELASRVLPEQNEFVTQMTRAMHSFTGVLMDCIINGGVRQYTPSGLRKKTHVKRNKKHKLLEHKVLKLDLANLSTQQESSGGTHASPRLHLRRGHWRHYEKDAEHVCARNKHKWNADDECENCGAHRKWLAPMWVGDKDLGVIHKDYEVVNHAT